MDFSISFTQSERWGVSAVPALLPDSCNLYFLLPGPAPGAYISVFLSHSMSEQFEI